MKDSLGRELDYLRVSVTDRCDLRCVYCMPEGGVAPLRHADVLRYEEIARLAGIFASLGVRKIRLTGGEPLARRGLAGLVAQLRRVEGVETIALTTNGTLLEAALPALAGAGLNAVNVSLDAPDEPTFARITRRGGVERVIRGIDAALACPGLRVKLNCVPTEYNRASLVPLARFAMERGVPLRFIELMPIGEGRALRGLCEAEVKAMLAAAFGPLTPLDGNEPAQCRRYTLPGGGRIGFISPMSHCFCASCNRLRLTAGGMLKTCLQYDAALNLKPLLAGDDAALREAVRRAVLEKPAGHHFGAARTGDDARRMSEIGG